MRIGMILRSPYPPDIRVDKEMRMLLEGGHEVHLLCAGRGERTAHDRQDASTVHHVRPPRNSLRRMSGTLLFHLTFRHPLWYRECDRFVRDFSIDVVHVHDLPLVGTAWAVAQKHDIPIVADMHENYAAALRLWYRDSPVKSALLYNPWRWRRYEASILRKVSHILAVVDESKEYLTAHGLSPDKITVIPNVTHPDFVNEPIDQKLVDRYAGHFLVCYVGGFGPHRGLDVAIAAMPHVRSAAPSARLLLVGDGWGDHATQLHDLAAGLGSADAVEFTGWRPLWEVPSYISASDVCLVPYNPTIHTHASGPHKLFQYWMMRKPVVVSSCRSLRRIVEQTKGGLVFAAGDPQDLALSLVKLHRDRALRCALAANGHQAAVSGDYSWRHAAIRLNDVYHNVAR